MEPGTRNSVMQGTRNPSLSSRQVCCIDSLDFCLTNVLFSDNFIAIAIRETAKVGDQANRRMARGIDDLDFFIGDEALDATGYSVKVTTHAMIDFEWIS